MIMGMTNTKIKTISSAVKTFFFLDFLLLLVIASEVLPTGCPQLLQKDSVSFNSLPQFEQYLISFPFHKSLIYVFLQPFYTKKRVSKQVKNTTICHYYIHIVSVLSS